MNKIEELFNPLIDAFDMFLNIDEKEIGCLTEREHERFLADRNYYSQLFVEKLNGDMEQLVKAFFRHDEKVQRLSHEHTNE